VTSAQDAPSTTQNSPQMHRYVFAYDETTLQELDSVTTLPFKTST
jgi:hypothetical protein